MAQRPDGLHEVADVGGRAREVGLGVGHHADRDLVRRQHRCGSTGPGRRQHPGDPAVQPGALLGPLRCGASRCVEARPELAEVLGQAEPGRDPDQLQPVLRTQRDAVGEQGVDDRWHLLRRHLGGELEVLPRHQLGPDLGRQGRQVGPGERRQPQLVGQQALADRPRVGDSGSGVGAHRLKGVGHGSGERDPVATGSVAGHPRHRRGQRASLGKSRRERRQVLVGPGGGLRDAALLVGERASLGVAELLDVGLGGRRVQSPVGIGHLHDLATLSGELVLGVGEPRTELVELAVLGVDLGLRADRHPADPANGSTGRGRGIRVGGHQCSLAKSE